MKNQNQNKQPELIISNEVKLKIQNIYKKIDRERETIKIYEHNTGMVISTIEVLYLYNWTIDGNIIRDIASDSSEYLKHITNTEEEYAPKDIPSEDVIFISNELAHIVLYKEIKGKAIARIIKLEAEIKSLLGIS